MGRSVPHLAAATGSAIDNRCAIKRTSGRRSPGADTYDWASAVGLAAGIDETPIAAVAAIHPTRFKDHSTLFMDHIVRKRRSLHHQ
ncbi:hypothetical protein [Prescottella equi]|uniref:hypothetical protein n=1 Tax=Rhodococcus hoagii TaxID=43767 RepID=UPI001EECDDC4|nr:hypothetical protein [Prescottella equi]